MSPWLADKGSTLLGAFLAALTAGQTVTTTPTFSKSWWTGLAAALALAGWGYLTNKGGTTK